MTDVVIQHELVRMKVRKRLAWILFRRQRISLEKSVVKMIARVTLSFGRRSSLEINKNGRSHEEGHEADGVAHEINVGENL